MLRVGILGCGMIAARVADSLKGNKNVVIEGVASRERNKAKKFAAAHCPDAKVFSGYEKLAASDDIDLIYIATPNTYHYEHAILCIKEYKNVLVEKPFAMSKAETDSIFFEAKNRGVFVAEAMWPSYLPLHMKALEWIEKGRIGAVKYVTANLGYDIANLPRLNSPVLGGGSYLDLGVYTTNFALGIPLILWNQRTEAYSATSMSPCVLIRTRTELLLEREERSSSATSIITVRFPFIHRMIRSSMR